MTPYQIAAELDRLEALIQPADSALEQLSALVHSHDGPLFDAVGRLKDELLRRVAESIGTEYDLLSDWWLAHQFGAVPMTVIVGDGPPRQLASNADLAEFLAEV